jgi:hypothetical protein
MEVEKQVSAMKGQCTFFINDRDIQRLRREGESKITQIDEHAGENREYEFSIVYEGSDKTIQDNFSDGRYDSALDALEEVDDLLWHLTSADESVGLEDILRHYNWKKVMRTYEYYDEIRKQYE